MLLPLAILHWFCIYICKNAFWLQVAENSTKGTLSNTGFTILNNKKIQRQAGSRIVQHSSEWVCFNFLLCHPQLMGISTPPFTSTNGGNMAASASKVTSSQMLIQRQKRTVVPLVLIFLRAEKHSQNLPSRFPFMPHWLKSCHKPKPKAWVARTGDVLCQHSLPGLGGPTEHIATKCLNILGFC